MAVAGRTRLDGRRCRRARAAFSRASASDTRRCDHVSPFRSRSARPWLASCPMLGHNAMPYFALFYDTVDNFVERRQPHRQSHLSQIDAAYADGRLVLAGALKPSAGALLIFRVD